MKKSGYVQTSFESFKRIHKLELGRCTGGKDIITIQHMGGNFEKAHLRGRIVEIRLDTETDTLTVSTQV